jgi:histidyl-tRNA synthetase
VGLEGVRTELAQRGIAADAATALLETMNSAPTTTPGSNAELLDWLEQQLAATLAGPDAVRAVREVIELSSGGPAANHLRVDPWLARGLSYYTGPIFEVEFPGLSGSGGGGGRYDDLVGMFSGQTIPACGFSLGLERILLIMEERGLFPARLAGEPQVLVTQFDASSRTASQRLAHELRAAGLRTDLYPDLDRYGKQFKYAEERRIRFALLVSPREIEADVVIVKDLVTGEQVEAPRAMAVEVVQRQIQAAGV